MKRGNCNDTGGGKMARRVVTLEEKIEKAQNNVTEERTKYDKASMNWKNF